MPIAKPSDFLSETAKLIARIERIEQFLPGGDLAEGMNGLLGEPYPDGGYDRVLVDVDIEAGRLSLPTDEATYNRTAAAGTKSTDPGSLFETYRPDIERFNALVRANAIRNALPNPNKVRLRIRPGKHKIYGHDHADFLTTIDMQGWALDYVTVQSVTFGPSPRGDDFSQATFVADAPLLAGVEVGMCYGSGAIMSSDTDHSGPSATKKVNDDVALCNGAHIITSISADRLTFTADIPHPGGLPISLVSPPGLRTVKPNPVDGVPNRIAIWLTQFIVTGGFLGRAEESQMRTQYGGDVRHEFLGFVHAVNPDEQQSDSPGDPDQKLVHVGDSSRFFAQNSGYCGAEGRVLRFSKLANVVMVNSYVGAVGQFDVAERGAGVQLGSLCSFTRCAISMGATGGQEAIAVGGDSKVFYQNCVIVGGVIGGSAFTGGKLNFGASWIYGSLTGSIIQEGSGLRYDSSTIFENCRTGIIRRAHSEVLGPGESPVFIGCDTNIIDLHEAQASITGAVAGPNFAFSATNGLTVTAAASGVYDFSLGGGVLAGNYITGYDVAVSMRQSGLWTISNKSRSGFTLTTTNAAGSVIARQFDVSVRANEGPALAA